MREGLFIRKNKDRWEKTQQGTHTDANELARDFVQLVDDLSYAKTFYPNSRISTFINALASKIYLRIYQNKREGRSRFVEFFKFVLPLTVFKHRKIIRFSFFVFSLFYLVGFFSSQEDPFFARQVLGSNYVDMTLSNIEKGNPFGVYQSGLPFFNWVGIMINNIIVAFMYFVKGILIGILSMTSMIKEALRIGAFHQMFFSKGYGFDFVLAVMIHGILELPAIVFAASAGVVMGISYLFPGTDTRLNALRTGVKDGAKIVVGVIPVFIIAAFYEGFVTRHYSMPLTFNILILATSASALIWYFGVYPSVAKGKKDSIDV